MNLFILLGVPRSALANESKSAIREFGYRPPSSGRSTLSASMKSSIPAQRLSPIKDVSSFKENSEMSEPNSPEQDIAKALGSFRPDSLRRYRLSSMCLK